MHQDVGVFVIDGGERVFPRGVEPQQNVVFLRGADELPGALHLPFGEPSLGHQRPESLVVSGGQYDDGRCRVGGAAREGLLENAPHALELTGHVTRLLGTGVRNYREVRARHTHPCRGLFPRQDGEGSQEKERAEDVSEPHRWPCTGLYPRD